MILESSLHWTLELETGELRLLLQALGNRLITPELRAEAAALGDKLTKLRAEKLKALSRTADQLDTALQSKQV